MHEGFSGSFPDYAIFICKLKTDECFIFMKRFLVYKLETFKNCKEVKNMMMIIALICIILLSDISMNLLPNFQKGWAWQDLSFKRGFSGKEGCNFSTKNKTKSGIFNDKKSLKTGIFCSIGTKNSNWEILIKNLVTFKR